MNLLEHKRDIQYQYYENINRYGAQTNSRELFCSSKLSTYKKLHAQKSISSSTTSSTLHSICGINKKFTKVEILNLSYARIAVCELLDFVHSFVV